MKKVFAVSLIGAATLLGGCASVLNDQTQQINVSSSNAKPIQGSVDGVPFNAPGIVSLRRQKASKIITVDTPGCTKQTALENNIDLKFFANLLIPFGTFGSSTDYSTEKMWRYSESVVIACGQ